MRIASSTPPALSLSKVLNSRNSLPCALTPRTKTGMARGSRAQWRRSGFGVAAAENPLPRRIRHHNQYKGDPLGGLPQMTSIFGAVLRKAWRGVAVYGEELARKQCATTRDPVSNVRKNTKRQSRFSNETMTMFCQIRTSPAKQNILPPSNGEIGCSNASSFLPFCGSKERIRLGLFRNRVGTATRCAPPFGSWNSTSSSYVPPVAGHR